MYARVIETRMAPERLDALERLLRSELVPALRKESGFCGVVGLVDRERARALLVLLWETEEEAARPLSPGAAPFREACSTVAELLGSHSWSATVWEVNARG